MSLDVDELSGPELVGYLIGIAVIAMLLVFFTGWCFTGLWNSVMPAFWKTAPHISFWQGVGAILLLSFIRGAFSMSRSK